MNEMLLGFSASPFSPSMKITLIISQQFRHNPSMARIKQNRVPASASYIAMTAVNSISSQFH